jgi:hypothetical protein
MTPLLFWIGIGILGFLLYISPGIFVHRMYEGFTATVGAGVVTSADATAAKVVNLQPSAAPVNNNQIDNLLQLLNTPTDSPTRSQDPQSNRPIEHATTKSQPESANTAPGPSEAVKQGDLFNTTKPGDPQPGVQGMLGSMGTQGVAPAQREIIIQREIVEVPRVVTNPNCPDMREYIRKDSIPCWGCKLR